jgi:DNA-binding beta-propeller fold protein YncE
MRRLVILVGLLAALVFAQRADAVGLVATWPVGHQPFSVAIDPTDGRVFVSNSGTVGPNNTGTVSVINPATGLVTSLTTTNTSDVVAVDAGARRLYSSNANGTLDVIDLDSGSLLATLPVGGLGVAVDPVAHRIYTGRAGSLSVIDGMTNTVVGTRSAPCCETWFNVVLDPGLHRVYVSNVDQTRPTLVVLDDRDDLTIMTEIPIPQPIRWALGVDPTTHNVYVGGSDPTGPPFAHSSFFVVDPTSLSVTQTTQLTGFPAGIAVAPTTHRIFMTDLSGNRVVELDSSSFAVIQTIPLPWGPSLPAMHPDGRLYVPAYQGSGADVLGALDVGTSPVIDSVTFDPSVPRTNDLLHAMVVAHDSQGRPLDPSALTYEWFRDGNLIVGETRSVLDLSVPGNGDRGETVLVRVTAHDGQLSSTATASVTVANTAPSVTVSLNSASPKTNDVLTATAVGTDVDSDTLSYTYTWSVNGVVKRTATTAATTDRFDLKLKGNGDKGDLLTVRVTAFDGAATSIAATASATVR